MNAKIETPDLMIYAMALEIDNFNTVLHGVSSPLPILAMSVARKPTRRIWPIFQEQRGSTLSLTGFTHHPSMPA